MTILATSLTLEQINSCFLRIQRKIADNQASLTSNVNKIVSNTSGVSSKYDDTALRNEISALQAILFQVQQSDENQNKRLDDHEEQIDQNVQNIAVLQNLMSNIKFEYDIDTNTITFTNPSGDKVEVLLKDTTYSFGWDSETHALSIVDNFTGETIFNQVVDTFYSFSWNNGVLTISDNRHDSPIAQISFDDRYYTESEIQTLILDLIPATASASNQLADKNWVNSSIETSTATFRGTYDSTSEISSVEGDNNDYLFVKTLNSSTGLYTYTKYTWVAEGGDFGHWKYAYDLNTSGFTSDQLAAINSGITSTIVENLLNGCYTGKTAHTLNTCDSWKSLLATKCGASATYCDSLDYFNTNVLANFCCGYLKANRYCFNDRVGFTNRSISDIYSAANLGVATTCEMGICEFFCRVATCNKLRSGEKLTINYGWSNASSMRLNYPDGTSNCVSGYIVQFWPDVYSTNLWDNTKSGWYNIFAEINTLTSKRLFRIYKGSQTATFATVTEIKYANAEKAANSTCFGGCTWSNAVTAIRPACTNTTTNALYPILLGTICNDCNGSLGEVYKNTNMFANPGTGRLITCQYRAECLLVSTLSECCTGFNSCKWVRMDLNTGVSNQVQINGPQNTQKGIFLSTEGGANEYKNIALTIGSGNENRGLGHYSGGTFCWLQYYDCANCERHTRPTEFFVNENGGGVTIRSKCDGTYANAPSGASLTFTNCGNTQPLCLVYEDRDVYRVGNSLTLKSDQTAAWFVTPRLETKYFYNFGGCATCVAENCWPSIVFTMRCIYNCTPSAATATWKACDRYICFCGSDGSIWANDVRRDSYAGFVYTCSLPSAQCNCETCRLYIKIKTGRTSRNVIGKTFRLSLYSMDATLSLDRSTNYYCGTYYGSIKYSRCGYTEDNSNCFWLSYVGYRSPVLCSDDNFSVICCTKTAPTGVTFSCFCEYVPSTALTGVTLNGTSATVENNVATLEMTPSICRTDNKVCVCLGNKCSAKMTLPDKVSCADCTCLVCFIGNCDRPVMLTYNCAGGCYTAHGRSYGCPFTFNPATGVLTAKTLCGDAATFGGCTYAQACADIRDGLSSHDCLVKYEAVTSNSDRNILMMACDGAANSICPVYFNNVSGKALTYNACCGLLKLGPIVAKTSASATPSSGAVLGLGYMELSAATPFIDFHRNHACQDYSSRIIDDSNGLCVIVNNATGCTASTTSCTFCFLPTGVFKSPYDICSTNIRATSALEALNFYNMTQVHGTQPDAAACCPNITFTLRCRYSSGSIGFQTWSTCERCVIMCGCDGGLYAAHKGCSCLNWHGIVTCQCNYSLTANTIYYIKVGRVLDGFMTGTTELDIMASGSSLVDKVNIKWLGGCANDAANVNGIEINATNYAPLKGLLGIGWVRTGTNWNCANDIYIKVCAPATATYCFGLNRTLLGCSGAAWSTSFSCTTTAPSFTCFICTKPNGAKAFHWTSGTLEATCVKVGDVYQFSYTKPTNGNQPIFYGLWDITNHICNTGTQCLAGFNGKVLSMTATNTTPVEQVDVIGKITSHTDAGTLVYANRIKADYIKPAIIQCISSSTCSYYLGFILCGGCQIFSFNGYMSPYHLLTTPKVFYYNGSDACYHLDSCTGTTKGNITVQGTECIRDSNAACCINHLVCFRTRDTVNANYGVWTCANMSGTQVTLGLPGCSTWIGLKANCSMVLPIGHNNSSYIQGEIWITC